MSHNKRRYQVELEDDSETENNCFYKDHFESDDSLSSDEGYDVDDPLGSDRENCIDVGGHNNEDSLVSDRDDDSQNETKASNDSDSEADASNDSDSETDESGESSNLEDNNDPLASDSDDSDFEIDGDDKPKVMKRAKNSAANTTGGRKGQKSGVQWTNVPSTFIPRKNIPTYKAPQIFVDDSSTPADLFFQMFSKDLIDWIVTCTNERLDILALENGESIPHTEPYEMILVLAILLVMGFNRLPDMSMYWSQHPSLGNKSIKNAMARDRFSLLASKLYFNHPKKPPKADKTYYVNELVKYLKKSFSEGRSESTYQAIDETMVKFKGRSVVKQFMPKKKFKRGVKIWSRSDSMSGFCYDFNVYKGREEGAVEGNLGERVVITLCSTIRDKDVVICTDRFFTSYELMKKSDFALVGTCMTNRKNIPNIAAKLQKGESIAKSTSDGVIAFKWQDSKEVTLLSNCHKHDITTVQRKQKDGVKKSVPCPEAIAFYNKYMGGVDMTDQYTVLYDIDRKSDKWWKRVFQRLLMTSVTNAWILHKQLKQKKIPLIDFLIPLTDELIEIGKSGSIIQRKYQTGRPSKRAKHFVNVQHLPVSSTKRRCRHCASKNMQKRTKFLCSTCEVPLCVGCFLPYHH